jgi:hypothetical protein
VVERACLHPVLRHALIDEHGYVQWPNLTARERRVARDSVRLMRVDGRRVSTLPQHENGDGLLPQNPTPDALRTLCGRAPDLQRRYLSLDLTAGARRTPTPWSASSLGRSRCASR